jgi:predicted GIY-YIG superfamily endonuclease
MTEKIDIVELIDDKSSTIGDNYQNKVIQKIKESFTSEEEQLFAASFQCYTKYNQRTDFVIPFNGIWKWLGYGRVEECKRVLVKNFKENVDYKIDLGFPQDGGKPSEPTEDLKNLGGRPREYITITINCFKKLCLKSKTDKANQIHDYYVKLEEALYEVMKEESIAIKEESIAIKEESVALKTQLKLKNKQIDDSAYKNEQNLLIKHDKKRCIYLIQVTKKIIKFGITSDIIKRLSDHKRDISEDILLIYVLETVYNNIVEKRIKELCNTENDMLYGKRITMEFDKKPQTELIRLDGITLEQLWNKVLTIDKNINKDEIFLQLESEINILKNKTEIKEEKDNNEYRYIYLQSTDTTNQYIIDVTNDLCKSKDIYETNNCKQAKNLAYVLLDAYYINGNIFELPYNAIKNTLEYCIMTYDVYKINKNDVYRFNYIDKYVSRCQDDKLIIRNDIQNDILDTCIYQTYIKERIEYGSSYKVPIALLYDDINKWYIDNYPDSDINLHSVLEKNLKEEISKIFITETGIEKTVICVTIGGKKYSTYPGFEGFRIKEKKTIIYDESIYKEFFNTYVEYTGNQKDRVFRTMLMDMFVTFVTNNYLLHKDTKGAQRYKLAFINEFNTMFKNIYGVNYDQELRSSAGGLNLHGGYACCNLIK